MSLDIEKIIHQFGNIDLCGHRSRDAVIFKMDNMPMTNKELSIAQRPFLRKYVKLKKEFASGNPKNKQLEYGEDGLSSFPLSRLPYENVIFSIKMPFGHCGCWVVERMVKDNRGVACAISLINPVYGNYRLDFYIGENGGVDWGETFIKRTDGNITTCSIEIKFIHMTMMHIVLKICGLINCKNVRTVEIIPNKKHQKARVRKNKAPLISFKTLVILTGNKVNKNSSNHYALNKNRIHLCRGHFKTYTKEKPLMGKITGTYWWQPSVRGRKESGIVNKDYLVRNSQPNLEVA